MRLSVIQSILEKINFDALELEHGNYGVSQSRISKLSAIRDNILLIDQIPSLRSRTKPLLDSVIFSTHEDSLIVTDEVRDQIITSLFYVSVASRTLRGVVQEQNNQSLDASICIRLPDPSDFSQLLSSLEQFNKVLQQTVLHEDIGGTVKISTWEAGSFWIELVLGTQTAVSVVASIAWAAAVILKKRHEAGIIEQQVRSLEIKNESLVDIKKAQKEALDLLLAAEAKNIQDEFYNHSKDNETLGRLQWAIHTFADLINQGAEIHPSLNAPESVQNLFPDLKHIDTITSRIKQLTAGSSEGNGEGDD